MVSKKISFENFDFLAARGEKLHKQVVYPLRQSLIPPLGTDTLGRTMAAFIPYAWMGTLWTSLKAYSDADANWTTQPLPQAIWQVVNEEIGAK